MKGHNHVWVSGNIGGRVETGHTNKNRPACSFSLASQDTNRGTTWVRVNVYGNLAISIQQRLVQGAYLSVVGELMNRRGRYGELTEVRALDVVFLPCVNANLREREEKEEDDAEGTIREGQRPQLPELRQ